MSVLKKNKAKLERRIIMKKITFRWLFLLLFIGFTNFAMADEIQKQITLLKNSNADVRTNAAIALCLSDRRAVKPLIVCLKDPDWGVRLHTAEALGRLGDSRAVEPLIACLKDENEGVRYTSADALGKLGDVRAVEPLIDCMKAPDAGVKMVINDGDKDSLGKPLEHILKSCVDALGNLGDARAVSALKGALPDWYIKEHFGSALKKLSGSPTTDSEQVYFWICFADGVNLKKNWEKTKRVLLVDIHSDDQKRIDNAVYTFISLGNPEIIPELIRIIKKKGDQAMAETFLLCNGFKSPLANAARSWASAHGYDDNEKKHWRAHCQVFWGKW